MLGLNLIIMRGWGPQWSEDTQLGFRPTRPGVFSTAEVEVPETKTCHVSGYFTLAGDYGTFQWKIDGQPLGEPFDGFHAGVIRSPSWIAGTWN